MKKLHTSLRLTLLSALFILICTVYLIILVNLQITGQDYYTIVEEESTVRYVPIAVKRGEIYDRNGKPLVINTSNYCVELEYGAMPKGNPEFNAVILDTRAAIRDGGGEKKLTEPLFPFEGKYPNYKRSAEFFESATNRTRYASLLKRLELKEDISDSEFIDFLRTRYGIATYDKQSKSYTENYDTQDAEILLRTRFDMEYMQFSRVEPYTLAIDISLQTLTYIKELAIHQIMITEEPMRTYVYSGYASHILGTIGKIPAERLDEYLEKGYSQDAYIGTSGMEKECEEYLAGRNGVLEIVEDKYGNVISETVIEEPVPGKDVYLTIDIDLQMSAEKALRDNISIIHDRAAETDGEFDGEDASSGAVVALDPNSCEVLAIASYPTYNLSDFYEKYDLYAADSLDPLYNRATLGIYAPGSTFKPGVAAAVLEEGIKSASDTVNDTGVYMYYADDDPTTVDYTPRCWYYLRYRRGHGAQNIVQAIQNSCNYYFYETGRLLGIEKMNEYSRKFGLGEATGIEIGESLGILAGPAYSRQKGEAWVDGNTLQAAIGQLDNAFTPLQLAVYTSALVNGGTRYRAHLLSEVKDYPSGEVFKKVDPEVVADVEFKAGTLSTIKSAMKDVVESGSAARIFKGYDIEVGGKTGTAQAGKNRSDNALFIGFAPYAEPKIAVSVVIEKGANGTDAAYTAKALYDHYLKGIPYVALDEESVTE